MEKSVEENVDDSDCAGARTARRSPQRQHGGPGPRSALALQAGRPAATVRRLLPGRCRGGSEGQRRVPVPALPSLPLSRGPRGERRPDSAHPLPALARAARRNRGDQRRDRQQPLHQRRHRQDAYAAHASQARPPLTDRARPTPLQRPTPRARRHQERSPRTAPTGSAAAAAHLTRVAARRRPGPAELLDGRRSASPRPRVAPRTEPPPPSPLRDPARFRHRSSHPRRPRRSRIGAPPEPHEATHPRIAQKA